jgi:formate hydrogenlyase subunit 3/multisubunit Na+/H+ antiporter MnhD subunit
MMALVQHNYKKLLGYHAVSQVGYMIVGFGLGSVIGIAAGLFHMINNALYKSGLFLSAGCVERQTGCEDIKDLGGISRQMPVTFIATLIFALSISGIPPFNGFASKWMIYQGIIDFGKGTGAANHLWILWLSLTVIGSALTLASFIKFTGGIFLGRSRKDTGKIREAHFLLYAPVLILALVCVVFGVMATKFVVPEILMKVTGDFTYSGIWNSAMVSLLVAISIILGIVIYLAGNIRKMRTSDSFIGGEELQDETGYSALEFYKSFSEFRWLRWMYKKAEAHLFDIYDQLRHFHLWISKPLSRAHSGYLHDYAIWVLAGLIILLIILI